VGKHRAERGRGNAKGGNQLMREIAGGRRTN
jgi:hypothetical protein